MFSYVSLEQRIPKDHPLRGVRKLVDAVLAGMSKEFDKLYAAVGRPSIPPERLLRALLLQVFYSVPVQLCGIQPLQDPKTEGTSLMKASAMCVAALNRRQNPMQ